MPAYGAPSNGSEKITPAYGSPLRLPARACSKRPALAAFLDSTGLGNSPAVIRMLAKDESLLTKAGAKKFIDTLGANEKYWQGDKLELAKAKLAFTVVG
jgi:hypothetical protein